MDIYTWALGGYKLTGLCPWTLRSGVGVLFVFISSTDPSAELQVAQARINDLEAHILTQKAEVSFV